jgi:hypothetical protein
VDEIMTKLPKPVGLYELTDEEILPALEIPTWDKWSLGDTDPPQLIGNAEVRLRYERGHIQKGYIHLQRVVLKVRDDLWYESTIQAYGDAKVRWEKKKRDAPIAIRGRGKKR